MQRFSSDLLLLALAGGCLMAQMFPTLDNRVAEIRVMEMSQSGDKLKVTLQNTSAQTIRGLSMTLGRHRVDADWSTLGGGGLAPNATASVTISTAGVKAGGTRHHPEPPGPLALMGAVFVGSGPVERAGAAAPVVEGAPSATLAPVKPVAPIEGASEGKRESTPTAARPVTAVETAVIGIPVVRESRPVSPARPSPRATTDTESAARPAGIESTTPLSAKPVIAVEAAVKGTRGLAPPVAVETIPRAGIGTERDSSARLSTTPPSAEPVVSAVATAVDTKRGPNPPALGTSATPPVAKVVAPIENAIDMRGESPTTGAVTGTVVSPAKPLTFDATSSTKRDSNQSASATQSAATADSRRGSSTAGGVTGVVPPSAKPLPRGDANSDTKPDSHPPVAAASGTPPAPKPAPTNVPASEARHELTPRTALAPRLAAIPTPGPPPVIGNSASPGSADLADSAASRSEVRPAQQPKLPDPSSSVGATSADAARVLAPLSVRPPVAAAPEPNPVTEKRESEKTPRPAGKPGTREQGRLDELARLIAMVEVLEPDMALFPRPTLRQMAALVAKEQNELGAQAAVSPYDEGERNALQNFAYQLQLIKDRRDLEEDAVKEQVARFLRNQRQALGRK